MTIEEGIVAFVRENVTDRIYGGMFPASAFPANIKHEEQEPAIRYQSIGWSPTIDLSGTTMATQGRWQLSVFAPTYSGAKTLAQTLIEAFSGYCGPLGEVEGVRCIVLNSVDLYDSESQMHHVAVDVDILANP